MLGTTSGGLTLTTLNPLYTAGNEINWWSEGFMMALFCRGDIKTAQRFRCQGNHHVS